MRLPEQMPCKPVSSDPGVKAVTAGEPSSGPAVEPAGCCLQICDPITGCHCVFSAPFC
jgi:hypothetical protein